MRYYIYQTPKGQLKMSDQYVTGHIAKIEAKTEAAAKRALTNYKKMRDQNGTDTREQTNGQ